MRAARIENFGEPLVMGDEAEPQAAEGEVVVSLTLVGVNPLDVRVAAPGGGAVHDDPPAGLHEVQGCRSEPATAAGRSTCLCSTAKASRSAATPR